MSTWDPNIKYVQQGIDNRRFVSAKYSLLAAGPPRIGQLGGGSALASTLEADQGNAAVGSVVHPMGFIQNISLGQNKQIARIFEVGSDRSYFIPGRAVGQLNLGRIFMHGPTLLRLCYAAYQDTIGPTTVEPMVTSSAVASNANPHDIIVPPGFENVFMNLQSDMFDQHFGLLWYIKDNNEDTMGAFYFESANIPQHGLQTDASGVVFSENIGVQYDRMVPVRMGAPVKLISSRTPDNRPGYEDGYPGLGVLDGRHFALPHPLDRPAAGGLPRGGARRRPRGGHLGQRHAHRAHVGAALPGGVGHDHHHAAQPPGGGGEAGPDLLRVGLRGHHGQRHRALLRGPPPHLRPDSYQRGDLLRRGTHRGCHAASGGAGMNLPDTAELAVYFGTDGLLMEKQAGPVLDVAGRLAAAVVLMQLIDSQRRSASEVRHAERALGPTLRSIEEGHAPPRLDPESMRSRPRMFIPTRAPAPESREDFYQMGFIPSVPIGMDHGMVRLAHEKEAMPSLGGLASAAGQGVRRAAGWAAGVPRRWASGLGQDIQAVKGFKPGVAASPANAAMAMSPNPAMATTTVPKVTPHEFERRALIQQDRAAKLAPTGAPAAQGSAAPEKKAPGEKGGFSLPGTGALLTLGAGAAVAYGAPKLTGSVLSYGEKETNTPWSMQPYGAPRLNTYVNEYGQALPG